MIQPHNITKEELIREIESLRAERDGLLAENKVLKEQLKFARMVQKLNATYDRDNPIGSLTVDNPT